jgi:hypothetical protein
MGIAIFQINPAENYFYFCFLVLLALIFGITIYRVMRSPHLRRMRPITFFDFEEPQISKRCSVIVGIIIMLPLIIHAYFDNWQHFYSVSRENDQFYLEYLFPQRTVKLSDMHELRITTQYEFRRGASYRIKLNDANRREYTSQVMDASEIDANLARLNDAMKPYRARNIK